MATPLSPQQTPVQESPRREVLSPYQPMATSATPKKVQTSFDPSSITTADLQEKAPEIKMPDLSPQTTAGEYASIFSSYFQPNESLQQEVTQGQQNQNTALSSVIEQMQRLATRGQRTSELEDQYGIPDLTTELTDITNRYKAKEVSHMRQREAVERTAGLSPEQKNARLNELDRVQAREMADLAIIKEAASNNLLAAQSIVDRKVELEFADETARLDALKFFYTENKEIFTKKEQRLYEENLQREQAKYTFAKEQFQAGEQRRFQAVAAAAEAGATAAELEAIQSAGTDMDSVRLANEVVSRRSNAEFGMQQQLQQAQLANIYSTIADRNSSAAAAQFDLENGILSEKDIKAIDNSPQGKKLLAAADLKQKLNTYQGLVEQHGLELFGSDKAVLEQAYTDLQLAYKEAADLGVINGPDLTIVERAIKPANAGFWRTAGNLATFGQLTRNLEANIGQAQSAIDRSAELQLEQLYARNPNYRGSLYVDSIIMPFADSIVTNDEVSEMDAVISQ